MPDITAPTVRLYIPKFDQVCDVNVTDEQLFREQYQAIDEAAYLGGAAKPKANPFTKKDAKAKGEKTEKDPADPNAPPVDPNAPPVDPNAPTS